MQSPEANTSRALQAARALAMEYSDSDRQAWGSWEMSGLHPCVSDKHPAPAFISLKKASIKFTLMDRMG